MRWRATLKRKHPYHWLAVAALAAGPGLAQGLTQAEPSAAPSAASATAVAVPDLVATALDHLDREDPLAALATFERVRDLSPDTIDGHLGLARTELFLGRAKKARPHIEAARRIDPDHQEALAVHVRILIRAGSFDLALRMSERGLRRFAKPSAKLLAAHASALFRVQRTVDAASVYERVLELDPFSAEAHLRLGSGLLSPRQVPYVHEITRGIRAQHNGQLGAAQRFFAAALEASPGHPVAHRLLGEVLFARRYEKSMVRSAKSYQALAAALPVPDVGGLPIETFMPGFARLDDARKKVATRALALFGSRLGRLVKMRGRHDLLREDERTTDADVRSQLRGKRTFDGRVWDDVRGIGGLRAATGIEALDEAAQFGFDTLAHEVAHQAHLYAFRPLFRAKVDDLYKRAKKEDRFLDFYAASNEAEYFGQGVEAFVSLAKRPGCEKTHGHTRFELKRRDPALYAFIERVVEFDPLSTPAGRAKLLPLAIEAALISGRTLDAVWAARMMDMGPERDRLLDTAQDAHEHLKN